MTRLHPALVVLIPALAAALLYAPSLKFGFVWDDRALILENPEIRSPNPFRLFAQSFTHSWAVRGLGPHAYYRPIVTLSFWDDHKLWRFNPLGYHLTSTILNAVATAVVAVLALLLFRSFWPALFVGLVFALHPAHVESVAFVSGRTDLLMSLFLLIALILLIRGRSLVWAAVLFALALLCKEAAILFPALVLVCNPGQSPRRRLLLTAFVLAAVATTYLAARTMVLRGPQPAWGDVTAAQRVLLFLNAVGRYAFTTVFPFYHRLTYPNLVEFASAGWPTPVGLLTLAATVYALWRERNSAVGLGSGLFLLTLLPASNLFPPGPSYLSERLLYLPTAGAVIAIVALVCRLPKAWSRPAAIAGLLLCTAMTASVLYRLPIWKDELSLAETMVRERPHDPQARGQLGRALLERGQTRSAIDELRTALQLDPGATDARYELARSLRESNDLAGAEAELKELLRQNPDFPDAHALLGTVLLEQGDNQAAIEALSVALRQTPNDAMLHNNLGVALDQLGRVDEAEQEFRRALELAPNLALAHNNLGEVLLRRGDQQAALAQFRQALASNPDYGLALFNLGLLHEAQGNREEALRALLRAQELMPDFSGVAEALRRIRSQKPWEN